jgi:hypothetical protein
VTAPTRETPFTLALETIAPERFPVLREGIAAAGRDARDRDAFLMVREVIELVREIEPDEGMGAGIATMAAFLHHAYLFWSDGQQIMEVNEAVLDSALRGDRTAVLPAGAGGSRYTQLPSLRVWGLPLEGGGAEPLDGWFAFRNEAGLSVLAVFGLHPGRVGFTAVEVAGPWPLGLERADGSALFSATLPGAERAGLASIAGSEELLELAWRFWS